jgi:Zn-dependent peptidase ImmA (M78 family)/DNA-binding XRE family transcriptional regulator
LNNNRGFNGDRLRKARVYRGMTVASLAEALACQRQTVSMYENKKIDKPDDTVVEKMSKVLNFPVEFFYEHDVDLEVRSTYFRALLTTNKKYRNEQIQRIEFLTIIVSFLKEYVNLPSLDIPTINTNNPEEAAQELRLHWQLSNRPIDNIIYEVEQRGIIVTPFDSSCDFVDAFSQLIDVDCNSNYIIGYTKNKNSAARLHLDIAHELGHICLHEWSEDIEAIPRDVFKQYESEAHQFAGAFLLPADTFYNDVIQNPMSIPYYRELKKKWKVSIAAMIRRSKTLKVIGDDEYQLLMRTMQKRGLRKIEPLDDVLTTSEPSILRTAVQILLDQNVFTPKEFVQELSMNYGLSLFPSEIEKLLGLDEGTLKISNVIPLHTLSIK